MLILFLCVIIFLIIWLMVSKRKNRQAFRRQEEKYQKDVTSFHQQEAQFQQFYNDIEDARQEKKDTEKRRRVTPKLKTEVCERDKYTCQICGISKDFFEELCPGLGDYMLFEIDHVVSVKQGGSGDDINNLQTLCWRCNRKKSWNKTNTDVKDLIDYGIHKMKPVSRTDKVAALRSMCFNSPEEVFLYCVWVLHMNEQRARLLVDKAYIPNMGLTDQTCLAVNILCKMIEEHKL